MNRLADSFEDSGLIVMAVMTATFLDHLLCQMSLLSLSAHSGLRNPRLRDFTNIAQDNSWAGDRVCVKVRCVWSKA